MKSPAASGAKSIGVSLRSSIYLIVMLGTMVAVTFGVVGRELVYQTLVVGVSGLVLAVALQLARRRGGSYGLFAALTSLPLLITLSVLINGFVSGNHVYLVFFVSFLMVLALDDGDVIPRLLHATNVTYVVYLAGSVLVYAGVIDLGAGLNIFDAADRLPWLRIRTLVGLYGSTAHVDSISLFVALLNLACGKSGRKWMMVILGLAASVLAVRYTPFAALAIALAVNAIMALTRRAPQVSRGVAATATLVIASSSFLLVGVTRMADSSDVTRALDRVTNGRTRIWSEMLDVYSGDVSAFEQLFGTAATEEVYQVGGWPRVHPVTREVTVFWTANPHNTFLTFTLSYGLVPFLALALVLALWATRFPAGPRGIVYFYILAVGITNAELMTFHFPVYVAWVVVLGRRQVAERPALAARSRRAALPAQSPA